MIYIYKDIQDFSECDYNFLLNKIPLQRVDKCEKFKFFVDKKISMISYLLLSYGLKKEFEIDQKIEFSIGKYGKPYIKNSNIQFNLSHTRKGVLCCIGNYKVGCDIESKVDKIFYPELVFHQKEYEIIKFYSRPEECFTKLWTLKESYSKFLGTGLNEKIKLIDFSDNLNKKNFKYNNNIFVSGNLEELFWSVCYEEEQDEKFLIPEIVSKIKLLENFIN